MYHSFWFIWQNSPMLKIRIPEWITYSRPDCLSTDGVPAANAVVNGSCLYMFLPLSRTVTNSLAIWNPGLVTVMANWKIIKYVLEFLWISRPKKFCACFNYLHILWYVCDGLSLRLSQFLRKAGLGDVLIDYTADSQTPLLRNGTPVFAEYLSHRAHSQTITASISRAPSLSMRVIPQTQVL